MLSVADETMYVLELKKKDSTETMLRCVLEGYTYLRTVNTKKLIDDFGLNGKVTIVKASPFVFKEQEQWKEMQEDRIWLKKLIELLDVKPYYITKRNEKYYVGEK